MEMEKVKLKQEVKTGSWTLMSSWVVILCHRELSCVTLSTSAEGSGGPVKHGSVPTAPKGLIPSIQELKKICQSRRPGLRDQITHEEGVEGERKKRKQVLLNQTHRGGGGGWRRQVHPCKHPRLAAPHIHSSGTSTCTEHLNPGQCETPFVHQLLN